MLKLPGTLPPRLSFRERRSHISSANVGFDLFDDERDDEKRLNASVADASDFIMDIREWDVPYHVRVMIDLSMLQTIKILNIS
jgi:hypothetical protein